MLLKIDKNNSSETIYHQILKRFLFKKINRENFNIIDSSTEKYLKTRRGDIYFKFRNNKEIVIEVQHSAISYKEILSRTKELNKLGLHVMWALNGLGSVVSEPKFPIDKKNVKISPVEKFLHRIYGGRVYYINVDSFADRYSISLPFALHYTISNKKPVRALKSKYKYYYFRNSNFSKIPSWKILCTDFNGFKIARFYDKNFKSILREFIEATINKYIYKQSNLNLQKKRNNKKLIKYIIRKYKTDYGIPLILECFDKLINRFNLSKQVLERYNRKWRFNRK